MRKNELCKRLPNTIEQNNKRRKCVNEIKTNYKYSEKCIKKSIYTKKWAKDSNEVYLL